MPGATGRVIERLEPRMLLSVAVTFAGGVFEDTNGDGNWGAREDGMEGWTVQLRQYGSHVPVATVATDRGGGYRLSASLDPGAYFVTEVVQSGWARTAPPGGTYSFEVTVPATYDDLDFGNIRAAEVRGTCFSDEDADRYRGYGEAGLEGWTVELRKPDGAIVSTALTDLEGHYSFAGLLPGSYQVGQIVQMGWVQTAPNTLHAVDLSPGDVLTGQDFANAPTGEITGTVYDDLDLSKSRDAGEPGLAGWTVVLENVAYGTSTAVTDASGRYVFAFAPPGNNEVHAELPPGWVRFSPEDYRSIWLTPRQHVAGQDLGHARTGSISGTLFDDRNDDGIRQLGEAFLSGWPVMLREEKGGVITQTTTNQFGVYSFTDLKPDTYMLTEILQAGWVHTVPSTDSQLASVSNGQAVGGVDFANTAGGLLDFEDMETDTVITTQYVSRGIRINLDVIQGQPVVTNAVVAELPFGYPHSSIHVADISQPAGSSEFPPARIVCRLDRLATKVSAYVGALKPWVGSPLAVLTAYSADHGIVGSAGPVTTASVFNTLLEVTCTTPAIAYFTITSPEPGPPLGIDDLRFITPLGSPDFSLVSPVTEVNVGPGGSNTATINIGRFNGSAGDIQFSASGLPAGVSATFAPNPADGTSVILTLSAASGAPATPYEGVPIVITGTPADASAGEEPRSMGLRVIVRQNFSVSVDAPLQTMALSAVIPVKLTRLISFTGFIVLEASGLPAGVTASFMPAVVTEPDYAGTAFATAMMKLTADPYAPLTSFSLTVTASHLGETAQTSLYVQRIPGFIDSISPEWGETAQALKPGTLLVLKGDGFLPGSQVQFGNSGDWSEALYVSPDYTELDVLVPRLATTGVLTIHTPNGRQFTSDGPFTISSYRNTNGYCFHNPHADGVSWGDVVDLYGYDQTHWLFIPSPFAGIYAGIADAALGDGQCYGVSRTTQMFVNGDARLIDYPGEGGTIWDQEGVSAPSNPLYQFIHVQHTAQISAEGINHAWTSLADQALFGSMNTIVSQVYSALLDGDYPLISMLEGTTGHTVVAYDLTSDPNDPNGFYIWTYDPNREYLKAEETDYDLHRTRELNSRIHVTGGKWYRIRGDGPDPEVWSGGEGSILVTRYGVIPVRPTIPSSLSGIWTMITGESGEVAQVADGSGRFLLKPDGAMNDDLDTRLTSAVQYAVSEVSGSRPLYLLGSAGGPYTYTLRAMGDGTYSNLLLGDGLGLRLSGIPAIPGLDDQVTLDPAASSFAFSTQALSKPYDVEFIASAGNPDGGESSAGAARTVSIRGTSFAGGGETFRFDSTRQTLIHVHHGEAAEVQLTFSQPDSTGVMQVFVSQPVLLHPGDSAVFAPADWSSLNVTGVAATITSNNGEVTTAQLLRQPGTLLVEGTDGADTFYITLDSTGQMLQAFDSYPPGPVPIEELPVADAPAVQVQTFGGGDRLFVSLANGTPVFSGGFVYESAGYSTLHILNPRPADELEFGAGVVTVNGTRVIQCATASDRYVDSQADPVIRLTSLAVSGGVGAEMGWTAQVLSTGTLAIGANCQFDLADRSMIIRDGSLLADVRQWISTARNADPLWTGPGLTSGVAAAGRLPATGLSCVLNRDDAGVASHLEWQGEPVDENCILIKNLPVGDTTLDGRIDARDYIALDRAFLCGGGPGNGCVDADYNGRLDGDDYYLLDCSFLGQTAVLAPAFAATHAAPPNPPAVRPHPEMPPDDATAPATAIWPWSSQLVRASATDAQRVPADDAVTLLPDEDLVLGRREDVLA